jgi:hypothetical protein
VGTGTKGESGQSLPLRPLPLRPWRRWGIIGNQMSDAEESQENLTSGPGELPGGERIQAWNGGVD